MAKYKGSTPVKTGDKVDIEWEGTWYRAKVKDTLASQFTVELMETTQFRLYADKDLTWRQV